MAVSGLAGQLQLWITLLLFVVMVPPPGIVDRLQAETETPFLRQFIPGDNFMLLGQAAVMPLLTMTVAALTLWVAQAPNLAVGVIGGIGVVLAAGIAVLCAGLSAVRFPTLGRVDYNQAAVAAFGLPMAAGLITQSIIVGLLAAGGIAVLMAFMLRGSL